MRSGPSEPMLTRRTAALVAAAQAQDPVALPEGDTLQDLLRWHLVAKLGGLIVLTVLAAWGTIAGLAQILPLSQEASGEEFPYVVTALGILLAMTTPVLWVAWVRAWMQQRSLR